MVLMAVVKGISDATTRLMDTADSLQDLFAMDFDTSEEGDYTEGVDASDDDLEYNPRPSPFFADAKRLTLEALERNGIEDSFVLRVKPPPRVERIGKGCLALYRGNSQFMGLGPIFWIRSDFEGVVAEVDEDDVIYRTNPLTAAVQTLLHEYGHVIYEWAEARDPELFSIIRDGFDDGEDFAEDFMRYATGDPMCSSAHSCIIRLYNRSLKD